MDTPTPETATGTRNNWRPERHLRGDGGRFVTMPADEQAAGLGVLAPTPGLDARRQLLAGNGYVPAVALNTSQLGNVSNWWDAHTLAAEYDAEHAVPQMTAVNQLHTEKVKRPARRTFVGDQGTELTMPNASAVRRFAADMAGSSFDVPVSGMVEGREAAGWVRVREVSPGVWTGYLLGDRDNPIGEAVTAVLEARRVTHGLREAGDLIARQRARATTSGVQVHDVDSTWVSGVGYDADRSLMITQIRDRAYGHVVSPEVFEAVRDAPSPGHMFNKLVKGSAPGAKVERCGPCGRFFAATAVHLCPMDDRTEVADAAGQKEARQHALEVTNRILGTPAPALPTPVAPVHKMSDAPSPAAQVEQGPAEGTLAPADEATKVIEPMSGQTLLSTARQFVASIRGRRNVPSWVVDENDDIVQATVELCLRAQAKHGAIGPGYVWRVATGLIKRDRNMHHDDALATRMLSSRVATLEQAQGANATEQQINELAREIRGAWEGRRKPSATFHRRTRVETVDMQAHGDVLARHMDVVADAASAYDEAGTSVATPSPANEALLDLIDASENATGKAEHSAVRRAAWDALAGLSGAPKVTARINKNRVTAIRTLMLKSDTDGLPATVARAMSTWERGEQDEFTEALFAPFDTQDPDERDAVVSQLRSSGRSAPDLWISALSAANVALQAA